MKKIIVNICLIFSAIVMAIMFVLFLIDFTSVIEGGPSGAYYTRFLCFWICNLTGVLLCIVSLIIVNRHEAEILKQSIKEGLAKRREKKDGE